MTTHPNMIRVAIVSTALAAGARTADIAEPGSRKLSTVEMGDAVLSALEKMDGKGREDA